MAGPQSMTGQPRSRRRLLGPRTVLVLIMAAALLVGCAQGPTGTTKPYAAQAAQPGAGVPVTMARADWTSGYFEAEVVAALLGELGYQVSPPAAREMSPDVFYPAVAYRVVDVWANGWFPLHDAKLETVLPARGVVGDLASPVGDMVADGALLGYLIDKPTADRYGITTMDDLTRPEIAAIFDRDGNGKADLIGCQEHWECAAYINEQIGAHGWLVEQVQGDYPSLFDDVANRVRQGQPVLYTTWTPSYMIAELVPGRDVTWLQAPSPPGTNTAVAGLRRLYRRSLRDRLRAQQHPHRRQQQVPRRESGGAPAVRAGQDRSAGHRPAEPGDAAGREHPGRHRAAREAVDPDQPGGGRSLARRGTVGGRGQPLSGRRGGGGEQQHGNHRAGR